MTNNQWGTNQTLVGLNKAYAAKIGGGTIAGVQELHLLDAGALAFFDDTNVLIPAAVTLPALADVKKFWVAQGVPVPAQGAVKSVMIPRNARTIYTTYKAPVAQVSKFGKIATVGTTGFPTTALNGTYAVCVITDTSSGLILPNRTIRIEVPVVAGDTAALVGARLRDAINANADAASLLTATYTTGASDDYFTFTGNSGEITFTIGFDETFQYMTRWAYSTQSQRGAFAGFGTNDQVVRLVSESNISLGEQFRLHERASAYSRGWWGVTDTVTGASGLTFNMVTIEFGTEVQVSVNTNPVSNLMVNIPLVVGGAGNAAVLDVLTVLTTFAEAAAGDVFTDPSAVASGFAY